VTRVFTLYGHIQPYSIHLIFTDSLIYNCQGPDSSIHPSIFYTRLILRSGRGGAGAYPSGHWARGGVHPGQVASPSQGHTETNETNNHTHAHSLLRTILESPINLTCMFLDGGRKPEYPERTHGYTGRTCKLHTERPQLGVEPGTLSLWGHHTTVQPYPNLFKFHTIIMCFP